MPKLHEYPRDQGPGQASVAFRRRLESNTLRPGDREALEKARRVKSGLAANLSFKDIARGIGCTPGTLSAWLRRGMAKQALAYLEEEHHSDEENILDRKRKALRSRLEDQGENAVNFVEDAFRYHVTEDGRKWDNPSLAMWASERMFKANGWDQPTTAKRPVINIGELVVIQRMGAIAEDDAKIAARAGVTIDVTPIALPAPSEGAA